jgi:hypothetical protein
VPQLLDAKRHKEDCQRWVVSRKMSILSVFTLFSNFQP